MTQIKYKPSENIEVEVGFRIGKTNILRGNASEEASVMPDVIRALQSAQDTTVHLDTKSFGSYWAVNATPKKKELLNDLNYEMRIRSGAVVIDGEERINSKQVSIKTITKDKDRDEHENEVNAQDEFQSAFNELVARDNLSDKLTGIQSLDDYNVGSLIEVDCHHFMVTKEVEYKGQKHQVNLQFEWDQVNVMDVNSLDFTNPESLKLLCTNPEVEMEVLDVSSGAALDQMDVDIISKLAVTELTDDIRGTLEEHHFHQTTHSKHRSSTDLTERFAEEAANDNSVPLMDFVYNRKMIDWLEQRKYAQADKVANHHKNDQRQEYFQEMMDVSDKQIVLERGLG